MILLIDNYDSFSYNLYQLIGEIDPDIQVIRNDDMSVDEIRSLNPDRIILSPGPGRPEDAGVLIEVVRELGRETPILGVCLGHQAICMAENLYQQLRSGEVDTVTVPFSRSKSAAIGLPTHLHASTNPS